MADQQPLYLTWAEGDEQGKARALAGMSPASMGAVILRGQGEGPVRMDPLGRAQARDTFRNAAPNVHVREGFDREDYDYFRPNARIPTDPREIIRAGMQAYEKIGVVHNIVDMMSDFVTQGVDLVHPVARHEEFYREWFYRVRGNHITERAANLLYRCGQFFSRRMTAIIPQSLITDFRKGRASEVCSPASRLAARSADLDYESPPEPPSGEIPFEYVFLNPLTLRPSNPALSFFGGPGIDPGSEERRDILPDMISRDRHRMPELFKGERFLKDTDMRPSIRKERRRGHDQNMQFWRLDHHEILRIQCPQLIALPKKSKEPASTPKKWNGTGMDIASFDSDIHDIPRSDRQRPSRLTGTADDDLAYDDILDVIRDESVDGTGAEIGLVPEFDDALSDARLDDQCDILLLLDLLDEFPQLQIRDTYQLCDRKRLKKDQIIETIQELYPESPITDYPIYNLLAEYVERHILLRQVFDQYGAGIRSRDDDGVPKIDFLTESIRNRSFIKNLKKDIQNFRIRFFDLIEEKDTVRTFLHRLRQDTG